MSIPKIARVESMKSKRHLLKFFTALLALLFAQAFLVPCAFAAATSLTVRVGVFDYEGFYGKDENGNPYGYGYEFLDALARRGNFKFEFKSGSWAECLEMLKNGSVDLLNSAQWTVERAEQFTYSKQWAGVSFGKIFVKAGNSSIGYSDFAAMDGMRVGLLKGNSRNTSFRAFAERNGFTAKEVIYDTTPELAAALQNGAVDSIVTSNLRRSTDERPVARFDPMPFYVIMQKDNAVLQSAINGAMEQTLVENPNFYAYLNSKYYGTDSTTLVLTRTEQDYIKDSRAIRVVYDSNHPPLESYDPATLSPRGINVDILKLIEKKTGLRFEFIHKDNCDDSVNMVREKEAEMLLGRHSAHKKPADLGLILTDNFLSVPLAIIGKEYRVSPPSVFAIPESYAMPERFIKKHFPDNKIIEFENMELCYKAIESGRADFTMENIYSATETIQSGAYSGLVVTYVTPQFENLSFALRSDISPILINILNKSIATLSGSEIHSLLLNYTTNRAAESRLEMEQTYRGQVVVALIVAAVLVFGALIIVIFVQLKSKKSLWEMACIDELTGYSNYRKFKEDAQELVLQNKDVKYICTIVDIDNCKLINEMHGFAKGDTVIKRMSKIIDGILDPDLDTFGRVYADRFAILKSYDPTELSEKRRADMERDISNMMMEELGHVVTSRFGRYFLGTEETDIATILEKANYAHSIAKTQIHSNVCNYDDAKRQMDIREKQIENKMESALKAEQFKIYLQSKYSLADETVIGAEALVRWQEEGKDTIYPSEFIPLFEKNGFIVKLDMYMFKKACQIIRGWMDKKMPLITVSVNFSRLHLKNENFVQEIITIADSYGIPKKYLEVEITESAMLDGEIALENILTKLHKAGFTLSMDDFGTGYSSLGLLKNLPVDVIKIDRSFFTANKYKTRTKTVVTNVIKMAKELGIHTVAEGVESFEHIEFLREIGCEAVQGYYYSKPIPAENFSTQAIVIKPTDEIVHSLNMEAVGDIAFGRGALGGEMPVLVYRLFELSMREAITQRGGEGEMVETLRLAGKIAGSVFAKELLDLKLPFGKFMCALTDKLKELKMGILQAESFNDETGSVVLTVANDLDCSGMSNVGKVICNYDEGFISGVLYEYTKKHYTVIEVDCFGNGAEICRFEAKVK